MEEEWTIFEEVPGFQPHWYVAIPGCTGDNPKFDDHKGAVKFCETLGRRHKTEYFEP